MSKELSKNVLGASKGLIDGAVGLLPPPFDIGGSLIVNLVWPKGKSDFEKNWEMMRDEFAIIVEQKLDDKILQQTKIQINAYVDFLKSKYPFIRGEEVPPSSKSVVLRCLSELASYEKDLTIARQTLKEYQVQGYANFLTAAWLEIGLIQERALIDIEKRQDWMDMVKLNAHKFALDAIDGRRKVKAAMVNGQKYHLSMLDVSKVVSSTNSAPDLKLKYIDGGAEQTRLLTYQWFDHNVLLELQKYYRRGVDLERTIEKKLYDADRSIFHFQETLQSNPLPEQGHPLTDQAWVGLHQKWVQREWFHKHKSSDDTYMHITQTPIFQKNQEELIDNNAVEIVLKASNDVKLQRKLDIYSQKVDSDDNESRKLNAQYKMEVNVRDSKNNKVKKTEPFKVQRKALGKLTRLECFKEGAYLYTLFVHSSHLCGFKTTIEWKKGNPPKK